MNKNQYSVYFDAKHYDSWTNREIDIPFYINQINEYGDPVLELGCGTGRLTLPIAEKEYKVVGIDTSRILLNYGRKKRNKKNLDVKFIQADMRNFYLNQKFNLILIPFNTIHHILSLDNIEKVLDNVKNHLSEEGRFIVELFNPNFDILNRDSNKKHNVVTYKDPYTEKEIDIYEKTRYDTAKQLLHLTWFYETEADVIKKREWKVRVWFPKEVDTLLSNNGFQIEQKYGDFDESPFTNNSGQQIIICKLN